MNLVIIDYKLSNLYSVEHACQKLGYNPVVSSDAKDIDDADAIILPGVGAFSEAMHNLNKLDLKEPIIENVNAGKPFMGVCLGMQLLFSESEEFLDTKGLGLIKGRIKKFPKDIVKKIPQINWNAINETPNNHWKDSAFEDLSEGDYMYFVHSYYAMPDSESVVLSKTNYFGIEYCSSVLKDNIFATQFHPEKSAEKGLSTYKNWLDRIKKK
jgi:imidazole glycerol-phosphate synthase subunit HisH